MRIKLICFLGILLFTLTKCKKGDSEIYIGTYRGMDQLISYPFIIEAKNDSLSFFDNQGKLLDRIPKAFINIGDTLKFETNHFLVGKRKEEHFWGYNLLDTVSFKFYKKGIPNPKYGAKFQKIEKGKNIDVIELNRLLVNNIWEYDVISDENSNPNNDLKVQKSLHFKKDSLYILADYYYEKRKVISEYETKSYSVFKIDAATFISYDSTDENPQPIFQILKSSSDEIKIKDFSSRKAKLIRYQKSNNSSKTFLNMVSKTRFYANCYDGYQGEYYFGDDVTHKKGNKFIIDFVSESIPNIEEKSGYIIVHFNINCHSQVGNFGLIQMDGKFKKTAFSSQMITHIVNKVSELKEWYPSRSEMDWLYYKDVHAFLMFKIDNGKIIDSCP